MLRRVGFTQKRMYFFGFMSALHSGASQKHDVFYGCPLMRPESMSVSLCVGDKRSVINITLSLLLLADTSTRVEPAMNQARSMTRKPNLQY